LSIAPGPVSCAGSVADEAADGLTSSQSPRIFSSTELLLEAVAAGEIAVDAASIAVPTSWHHAVSAQLLSAGIHVLIEKPITSTLEEADDLIALADRRQRILMVGHLERFNPAVQALRPLLRGPMFFEAHRLSIFSPRSLDVDVVLDLMIHDLDIVLTLAQSAVTQVHAVGLPILSRKTDIANVRVEFASGCVANFTASRVSTERVRKLRFFQPHQYVSIDYARQDLLVIEVTPPAESATAQDAQNSPPLPSLGMQKLHVTPGEPLRLEIESFLQAIQTDTSPRVSGGQARDALALALQIQAAIEQHAKHAGLKAFAAR
jgi:predicted dehydrogenase